MALLPAYRLKLYRNFKAIEGTDFHAIVRYYERFEDDIRTLDFDEYFDCTASYANALFETGAFGKHIVMADHLLETVIMQNIETWGGEDIYSKLLFKKSAALYNLGEYPQAEHILRELVKIDPWNHLQIRFLRTCLLRQKPAWLPKTRAVATLLILLSALVIALDFLVVKPFYPAWSESLQFGYFCLFTGGVLLLAAGQAIHSWKCLREAENFATRWRKKKSKAERYLADC